MYPTECRFPQNSKKRQEGLLQWRMQRNRGKQQKGKTRDLFKHTGDIKGTFLAKMGTIKDRNGKDLIEADEIKKRWQEYSEELYKKGLNNHHGYRVIKTFLIQFFGVFLPPFLNLFCFC